MSKIKNLRREKKNLQQLLRPVCVATFPITTTLQGRPAKQLSSFLKTPLARDEILHEGRSGRHATLYRPLNYSLQS